MPASYKIDVDARVIRSHTDGVVTDEDLRGHQQRLRNDPGFDPSFDQIWDFREVERIEISTEAVRQLARSRSYAEGARRALVAPRDAAYGLARMFQALHDTAPEDVGVFRTLEEALEWLGRD